MSALVLGAGEIGRRLAAQLVAAGSPVTLVSRSGTELAGARAVALDVTDTAALRAVAQGAETVYLTTNPPQYHRWAELWPPVVDSVLAAAEGKRLVMMGNLYAYGRATMPMTERSPLEPAEPKGAVRRDLWSRVQGAHRSGRVTAVEVRASDYFGPGAGRTAVLGDRFFVPLMRGKVARVVGDPRVPHSWSYLPDIAATLAAAGAYRGEWGRAWHVPSTTRTIEEIAAEARERCGARGTVARYPGWLFALLAATVPMLGAVRDSGYQFTAPFVLDAQETERELGVSATPWEDALIATAESYRA